MPTANRARRSVIPTGRAIPEVIEQLSEWRARHPLREIRERMTVAELAQALGVSVGTATQYLNGTRLPNEQRWPRIVTLCGAQIRQAWKKWHSARPGF